MDVAQAMEAASSLDYAQLREIAAANAARYRGASPFPHIVLDDFLPDTLARAALEEFPDPDEAQWHRYRNAREEKLMASQDALMPPVVRDLLRELNSSAFVGFLEELTGITGLIPDPHLLGGGMHQIQRGGYLKVHADFNRHPRLNLDRRLNLLVYLNPEWRDEYGGHLELWDRSMSRCEERILPVFNRCVLFSTTSQSFHGHPHPLTCPDGMARRSLALYYYTAPRAGSAGDLEHSTLFRRVPGEHRRYDQQTAVAQAKELLRLVTPPVLVAAIRRLRRRMHDRD